MTFIRKVSDVTGIGLKQEINEKSVLFITLFDDGLINRQGNGNPAETEPDLFVGKADPAIFEVVRAHLTEDMLECTGQTLEPRTPSRGAACKIEVLFEFKDRTSGGFTFLYGSESEGPPEHVRDLVRAAVRQTNPWYENFKQIAANT